MFVLSSDVSCRPVSVVLALPWPNVTDVQQMTPTHVTVQRWVAASDSNQPSQLFTITNKAPLVESPYSACTVKRHMIN